MSPPHRFAYPYFLDRVKYYALQGGNTEEPINSYLRNLSSRFAHLMEDLKRYEVDKGMWFHSGSSPQSTHQDRERAQC
jgi:hypothetical protein